MNTISRLLPLALMLIPTALQAQSFYTVTKTQEFLQTAASGAAADPLAPFLFQAQAATNVSLTPPTGSAVSLIFQGDAGHSPYRLERVFATKAALDAAFPNGTYRFAGASVNNVPIALTPENYPAATPQVTSVTNGTWSSGGVLVVDPSQPVTLNFSTFSGYGTAGAVAHMNFVVAGVSDNVELETNIISQAGFVPGITVTTTPFTTSTIPARTFTGDRIYHAWLDFDLFTASDTASISGSIVASGFSKELHFYIAAQTPGTGTPAPTITTQPTSQTASTGASVTFTVAGNFGGGSAQSTYFDWRLDGQSIDSGNSTGGKYSSTGQTLTVNNLTSADAGNYTVTIVNAGGLVISAPARLTVAAPAAPVITAQPRAVTVNAGSTVALTVGATGSPTPTFQWLKDNTAIAGANSDTLVIPSVSTASAGTYTVLITNSLGTVTSSQAIITVTAGQPSRLPNLSVRTNLAAAQTLIVGFSTSGAKTMLVRGVGPTLTIFGLSGVLADPVIELYNASSAKIDENNDWNANLAPVFNSVGAFALTSGSKDAALQRDCTGPHTAWIKGTGSGVVLVEVYDTGGSGKLMNVSARNVVGTGDNILIAGFVVDGTAAKTLLLRGVGAKLAEFGVNGVLTNPKLEIFNAAGAKVAENDNWNLALQPIARSVGAFDLTPGSTDAALVLTLAPGSYTAWVSGVGGTTGEAIVEVYEVP